MLGQYLGDGHLVTSARVPVLRISTCTGYPEIHEKLVAAIAATGVCRPGLVRLAGTTRAVNVQSYWMHWPCVLPQHGPGRKHERAIVLTRWQQDLVDADPWPLIRGLIHSDGCRAINRVRVDGKRYSYPRYFLPTSRATSSRSWAARSTGQVPPGGQPSEQHLDRAARLGRAA